MKIYTVRVSYYYFILNSTDVEARTPQETIDDLNSMVLTIATTLSSVIVIIILIIIIAIVSCCLICTRLKHTQSKINLKKNKKIVLQEVKGIDENMTDMVNNINNEEIRKEMITRIKKKLEDLKEFITTDFDDVSSNAPQVDLEQVDKDLENIISRFTPQEKP